MPDLARPGLGDWTGIVAVSLLLATMPAVYGGPIGAVVATLVDERAEIGKRIRGLTARAHAFAIENSTALILTVVGESIHEEPEPPATQFDQRKASPGPQEA